MNDYLSKLKEARSRHRAAFHMLTVTYPLIKDPKLLLGVLDATLGAFGAAIASVVYFERYKHTIPHFRDDPQGIVLAYEMHVQKRHGLSPEYAKVYNRMLKIKEEHKKSPIEFSRKDSFIICDDKYGLTTVDPDLLLKWIRLGKKLIADIEQIGMV